MTDSDATRVVNSPRGQQLYRLYDADGELLYIGISYSAIIRFAQHRDRQPWIDDVCRIEIEAHDVSRAEIEEMEAEAIRTENPRYNIVRSRRSSSMRAADPYGEYNHSWPAFNPDLDPHYWAVQRNLHPMLTHMRAKGCTTKDITEFLNEIVWSVRYPDMHHECTDPRWEAEMPTEYPFARTEGGWCHYECRFCLQQWKCRY